MKSTQLFSHLFIRSSSTLLFTLTLLGWGVLSTVSAESDLPLLKEAPSDAPTSITLPELEVPEDSMKVEIIRRTSSTQKGETNTPTSDPTTTVLNNNSMEKIQVTGSRIKQIQVEGPSPILILNKDEMEKTGYNSVADVLRDLTINSFGSPRERAGSTAPGTASVSLRGLGANRTLVLIDGKRVQRDSITESVDLNLIPFAAIKRVEILKDGASAVYGSDAIGGVVNIITHKNFNGTEASAKYFMSQEAGGNQSEASITSGYSTNKLSVTGVLYHRSNKMIYARDRAHAAVGLSDVGSPGSFRALQPDGKTDYKNPGGSTTAPRSLFQPAPDCPTERISKFGDKGDLVCQYNFADNASMRPSLQQTNLMLNTNYKLKNNVHFFARTTGTLRQTRWVFAPSPAKDAKISGARAKDLVKKLSGEGKQKLSKAFQKVKDDDHIEIFYRLTELGNRISDVSSHQYNTLLGSTVEIGETWEAEFSGGYNESFRKDIGVSGYALLEPLTNHFKKTFNALASEGERGSLDALNYQTWAHSKTQLAFAEASASGEVVNTPTGPISIAVGFQTYMERYLVDADKPSKNGEVIGNAGSEIRGDRSVVSGYVETSIPLASNLEWNLAGRADSYSDFGQTFSPKVTLRWQATPHIMFRSSLSQGFKAPDLNDLYKAHSRGWPTFIDEYFCAKQGGSACDPKQWKTVSKGNLNLKEEKSLSVNLGTFIQPTDNFSFNLEAWYLKLNNRVSSGNTIFQEYQDITKAELLGLNYKQYGIEIERDPVMGSIKLLTAPALNLSSLDMQGVDIATQVSTRNRLGHWALNLQHSHLLYSNSVNFPGIKRSNRLGRNGMPKWRNIIALSYAPTNTIVGTLSLRTIDKHKKLKERLGELNRYSELDLQLSQKINSIKGTLSAGIRNLLGSTPPIDNSNPSAPRISHSLYDGNGRIAWVQYKQAF